MTITQTNTVGGDLEVNVHWLEESPHPSDIGIVGAGWSTHMVEATWGETRVGYLRISYATREGSLRGAPTGLHFMSSNRGWCLRFDDPVELWLRAHLYAEKAPSSLRRKGDARPVWMLSREDAPTISEIEEDLARLNREAEVEREKWLKACGIPTIAFARVDDGEKTGVNWRRRGVAKKMYRVAGEELAKKDMVLMASTLQSAEAKALWESFERDLEMPTRWLSVENSKSGEVNRLVLDFRDN